MANVSGFNPSVTGVTGMETADLIEKVTSMVKPDVAVIIDSLAARSIERFSTTIQICDTGIEPGAGMGNRRKSHHPGDFRLQSGFHRRTYSHRLRTLIIEASEAIGWNQDEKTEKYFREKDLDMIVTSTDIDQIIKDFFGHNIKCHKYNSSSRHIFLE